MLPAHLHRARRKGEFSLSDGPITVTPSGQVVPRNRPARICSRCAEGRHTRKHSEIGCLQTVHRIPKDYVCDCEVVGVGE